MSHYSADELREMPTLSVGQIADLKVDDGYERVWLCRLSVEDGMPFDDQVIVERQIDGRWRQIATYDGSWR